MSPVTAPMVFTTVGVIVGTGGFGWFDLELDGEATSIPVEATLVLVLFTDAIRIDLGVLRHQAALPGRMLGVGLPLTIVAGTALAVEAASRLSVIEAALLAAVLAPTDAALGQAKVSDRRLPVRIRQTINVESGLNYGIAAPVVTVLPAAAAAEAAGNATDRVGLAARQVGFGVLAGVVAGAVGGTTLGPSGQRRPRGGRVPPTRDDSIAVARACSGGRAGWQRVHRSVRGRVVVRADRPPTMHRNPRLHRGRRRAALGNHVRTVRRSARRAST